jgi:hypothetical protein
MSLVRGLAVKISAFVVRRASPGCTEWAEGLAREVDFIASDWAALWWALGSMRVLLVYREARINSLNDVPEAAAKFVMRARAGFGLWVFTFQLPPMLMNYFPGKDLQHEIGCSLFVCGSTLAGIFCVAEWYRLKPPANDIVYRDAGACVLFYKAELERHNYTLWMWPFICLCSIAGGVLFYRDWPYMGTGFEIMVPLMVVVIVSSVVTIRRNNLQRIARLVELMGNE